MAKRLLYIAIHCWTSPVRLGSHAIATQFVERGWEVAYVSAPITPLHLLASSDPLFRIRHAEHRAGGQRDLQERLWHYVPFSLLAPSARPLMRSPWLFAHSHRLGWPNCVEVVRQAGFGDVDLLVLDSIYQPFWLEQIQYRRCLARLSDYNAGFAGYGAGARRSEMRILAQADLVITASQGLSQWAQDNGARQTMYVPNGVDLARFASVGQRPAEYAALPGPIAVFVGDINTWVDLDLLAHAARELPHVSFVMIGPGAVNPAKLHMPDNIHFLGPRPHNAVSAYLQHAQVGLIPFDLERCRTLVEHIHPLKLYEYLASGLPVVSSRWPEIEAIGSPARLCDSPAEFVMAIAAALEEGGQAAAYRQYAEAVSWQQRLAPLFERLA